MLPRRIDYWVAALGSGGKKFGPKKEKCGTRLPLANRVPHHLLSLPRYLLKRNSGAKRTRKIQKIFANADRVRIFCGRSQGSGRVGFRKTKRRTHSILAGVTIDLRPKCDPMPDNLRLDAISAYDEQGREILVPRQQWADEVLPESFKAAWNDPDQLRKHVLVALEDGFAELLGAAAQRLSIIDPLPERGAVTLALVQLANGQIESAQATLFGCLDAVD